jgi:TolB-like protein
MKRPLVNFFWELRRRRVFRVAGIYIVIAWVAVQVFSEAFPALDIPARAIRYVWLGAILGFPLALTFGWFYDITAEGIRRTPPKGPDDDEPLGLRPTDFGILAALAVVAVAMVWQLSMQVRGEATPSSREPLSVAVLPLDNLTGDPEQKWFVSGMHDAIISELSRISGLRVISRTSTLAYAGSEKRMPEIGRELNVKRIIEGSVSAAEDRVRIVVQLIDAEKDAHLWTEIYERDLIDVLRLQSDITRAIAEQVQIVLTREEERLLVNARAVDIESYEAYLKGNFHLELFTPDDMRLAQSYYQRSIELEPSNALGHWGLSRLCRFQLQAGLVRPREGEPRCRASVLRALELDNSLPEAHMGLALGYWLYDYDWPAADAQFSRALELNPIYAEAHMFYSHYLANMGRFDESTQHMELARRLDPFNPFMQGLHAVQLILTGSFDVGLELLQRTVDETPGLGFGYDVLWGAYARLGRLEESYEAAKLHFGMTMGRPQVVAALERGYIAGGYEAAMLEAAATLVDLSQSEYIPAVEISSLYEMGGSIEAAVEWLEIAYDRHDPTLPYIATAPLFPIDEPRYHELLRRMNLEQFLD